jgi:hypothetical protein
MPVKWRSKILLAELESSYGVDPVPTGAANGILAVDITLTPMEGSDVSRDLETVHLGAQETIPTKLHSKLSFKVELPRQAPPELRLHGGRGCAVAVMVAT